MARLIAGLPTERIRGFATNVSNDNATADEIAYAHEVSAHLDRLHAVIDTSRNGAGGHDDWCNPPGRLVGEPGGAIGDDVVDTNLWIKPPGESDGECGGGPPAGTWWPHAAVELTRGRTDVGTK
jgi:endoglucanase